MKRRHFLKAGLGAASAVAIGGLRASAHASPAPQKVLIVGAGLAGLVAGYELSKLNFDITILEAQERVGGRVLTLRKFGEGLCADAGAARIPDDHDLTLKYVNEFDLPLIPFYPDRDKFLRYRRGAYETVDWKGFEEATQMIMGLGSRDAWRKIKGGNDQLPKAFAARLEGKIHFSSPVVKVDQTGAGVRVKFEKAGKVVEIAGDKLICAVPFTVIPKIEFLPAFSDARMRAIRDFEYDSASRVFIETKSRFWQTSGLNGFAFGEDGAEIWNVAFGQPSAHGILQTYVRGGYSLDLTRSPAAARVEATVQKLSKAFPDVRSQMVNGVSKCWSEDPWVLGAWAHPSGEQARIGRSPEGRIYFAGEHLSGRPSWMQGALESGLRVVKEVVASPVNSALV